MQRKAQLPQRDCTSVLHVEILATAALDRGVAGHGDRGVRPLLPRPNRVKIRYDYDIQDAILSCARNN